jgi:GPH family glycoside/pentoside/hexuronide:cation symporter
LALSSAHDLTAATARESSARVTLPTLLNYSIPIVSIQFIYMMVLVMYMNFATDVLGVAPAVIGTIFFASKIWDGFSDPMVGYWSDRTRSSIGRRRSWMLGSAVPFALMTVMLWSPPIGLSQNALHLWIAVSVFGFYTAYTLFYIPQLAYGAEISEEPRSRNWIFAARQIALSVGMLGAFSFAAPLLIDSETARGSATTLARWGGAAACVFIVVCTLALPRERSDYIGRGATHPMRAIRDVSKNPHARLLLFVYFIEVFGIGGTSVMTVYVLKYVTKAADELGFIFLAYTIPAILSIPIWLWMGNRFDRKKIWLFAMGIQAVGYGSMAFQDEGRIPLLIATSIATGVGTACGQIFGHSIKADVIDYDEYMTGERKEGAYFAVWSLAAKLGTGLMIALGGFALQFSGFVPHAEQTTTTKWTILILMGGAPFLCITIGMIAFSRFSLTGSEHARIRAALDARARGEEEPESSIRGQTSAV